MSDVVPIVCTNVYTIHNAYTAVDNIVLYPYKIYNVVNKLACVLQAHTEEEIGSPRLKKYSLVLRSVARVLVSCMLLASYCSQPSLPQTETW